MNNMNKMTRFSIWYFVLFLLALLAIQNFFDLRRFQTVSYSDFRKLVDLKGVKDLIISTDTISGKLTPAGVEFLTKEGNNPELTALVKEAGTTGTAISPQSAWRIRIY